MSRYAQYVAATIAPLRGGMHKTADEAAGAAGVGHVGQQECPTGDEPAAVPKV